MTVVERDNETEKIWTIISYELTYATSGIYPSLLCDSRPWGDGDNDWKACLLSYGFWMLVLVSLLSLL